MQPSILSSEDREGIAQLQYFAKGVVDGLTGGRHSSPHRGSSVEFKEHRGYAKGDEIKSIDWKLFGKTDRLFIRQYEDETNLPAWLLLDQSGSMGYGGKDPHQIYKHQFAVRLAACLATLLVRQQDAVGLATFDTDMRATVPPRSQLSHLHSLLQSLVQSKTQGETSLSRSLQQAAPRLKRRGLLILLSDCFDEIVPFVQAMQYFRHAGHQVIVFQILHRDEVEFPFRERTQFRSLERFGEHTVDPRSIRQSYLSKFSEFQQELLTNAMRLQVEWVTCTSDASCGQLLAEFFNTRNSGKRGTDTGTLRHQFVNHRQSASTHARADGGQP
ncbi:MAG: DUF58 domain-containing protein [bacterium]|nr:DUF58 domain-containing protein [bacterium]